jgi:uncharacterized secreted protein with C-terminal beta-propeller domain
LQVINVSNPANPQRVGGYDTSGLAQGVAMSGNFAYVADGDAGLQIIDVNDPANPQRVGGYDTSGSAYGVAVSGNYAYVADGASGLQVIDVSNPASPQRVGEIRFSLPASLRGWQQSVRRRGLRRPLILDLFRGAFANWAASFGLTGTSAAPTSDPDGDGLPNGVEFVVGGNPTLPAVAESPNLSP